jgi:hypothetical protein
MVTADKVASDRADRSALPDQSAGEFSRTVDIDNHSIEFGPRGCVATGRDSSRTRATPDRFLPPSHHGLLNMTVSTLAVYEQLRASGNPIVNASFDETVAHLIDMSVVALAAPKSPS